MVKFGAVFVTALIVASCVVGSLVVTAQVILPNSTYPFDPVFINTAASGWTLFPPDKSFCAIGEFDFFNLPQPNAPRRTLTLCYDHVLQSINAFHDTTHHLLDGIKGQSTICMKTQSGWDCLTQDKTLTVSAWNNHYTGGLKSDLVIYTVNGFPVIDYWGVVPDHHGPLAFPVSLKQVAFGEFKSLPVDWTFDPTLKCKVNAFKWKFKRYTLGRPDPSIFERASYMPAYETQRNYSTSEYFYPCVETPPTPPAPSSP